MHLALLSSNSWLLLSSSVSLLPLRSCHSMVCNNVRTTPLLLVQPLVLLKRFNHTSPSLENIQILTMPVSVRLLGVASRAQTRYSTPTWQRPQRQQRVFPFPGLTALDSTIFTMQREPLTEHPSRPYYCTGWMALTNSVVSLEWRFLPSGHLFLQHLDILMVTMLQWIRRYV